MLARITRLVKTVQGWRAFRVFIRYSQKNGPILAGGLSLTALYSVFAGLYVGFAVLGLYIEADPALKQAVIDTLATSVPGLIDTGGGTGAIDLDDLFATRVLNWTGIVALVIVFAAALNWFASARSAVREMFGLAQDTTFFLLLKLKDLALVLVFAAVTLVSAALSVFSTSALGFLFGLVGIDDESLFATLVARIVGLAIVLVIDTAVLAVLFRVLSGIQIPWPRLIPGALIGGVALGVLKALGATLIGGGSSNPLLASFAVILGLLVWFGLICQVILLSATWIAVDMIDHGQDPKTTTKRHGVTPPKHRPRPRTRAAGVRTIGGAG